MGLFSWLSPSPEKRIAKAEKYISSKLFAEARNEVQGLDHPQTSAIISKAEAGLTRANLEAALSWAHAGDDERVARHMELARKFHSGEIEEEFQSVQREISDLNSDRKEQKEAHKRQVEERLLQVDTSAFRKDAPAAMLPDGLSGEDAEQAMMRISLVLENYAPELQKTVPSLGTEYATGLLALEDGKAEEALQTLLAMDSKQPLVRYERARAAYSLGDANAAKKEIESFAKLAGGHHMMGSRHSGVFLAQLMAETGEPQQAINKLLELRKNAPKLGSSLLAQLLFMTKAYKEAEIVLGNLILDHPRQSAFYKLLAMVRVEGGFRVEAMSALEQALQATHCAPGSCGYQPPDPEVKRMLATLYFEDGIELDRARELIGEIPKNPKPQWEDLYLTALAAKQAQNPNASKLAEVLLQNTPEEHPAHQRATQYLVASA